MTDPDTHPIRRPGRAIAAATAWLVAAAVIMLWSWNAMVADLFAVPAIDFRQAVAAEVGIAVLAATIGLGVRLAMAERQRSGGASP